MPWLSMLWLFAQMVSWRPAAARIPPSASGTRSLAQSSTAWRAMLPASTALSSYQKPRWPAGVMIGAQPLGVAVAMRCHCRGQTRDCRQLLQRLGCGSRRVAHPLHHDDALMLPSVGGRSVRLWDTTSGDTLRVLQDISGAVSTLSLTSDGMLATAAGKTIQVPLVASVLRVFHGR